MSNANCEFLRRKIAAYRRFLNRGLDPSLERFYQELMESAQAALEETKQRESSNDRRAA